MPKSSGFPVWFQILESVRKLSQNGSRSFVASELAEAAGWLSKFVRWGYVLHDGSEVPAEGSKRWIRKYKITKFGLMCEPTPGGTFSVPLNRLIAAARDFQAAYGKKEESLAWREFIQVLDGIDLKGKR